MDTYARRIRGPLGFELVEVAAGRGDDALLREARALLAAIGERDQVVLLDAGGRSWDSPSLARQLQGWREQARDVTLLIGGAAGVHASVSQRADLRWSLSPLTFPHMLVRVMVAEQLYRAWSLLNGHPYHRS